MDHHFHLPSRYCNFAVFLSFRSLAVGKMTAALSWGGRHRGSYRHLSCPWPQHWRLVILVTCMMVFWHDKSETWARMTFEWVVCTTARVLCLKQGWWFSCSRPLTFLDPAQMNEGDFVPSLNKNSSGPPHDDAAWFLWGCMAFFKFHIPTLPPHTIRWQLSRIVKTQNRTALQVKMFKGGIKISIFKLKSTKRML